MSFWTTKSWWASTAERAIKTFAQSLLATIGIDQVGLLDIGWTGAFSVAGVALLVSFLTSVVSTPAGPDKDDPSLV